MDVQDVTHVYYLAAAVILLGVLLWLNDTE